MSGFSLLEFLIYISILSIVGLLAGGMFVSINQGNAISVARTEVDSAIRFALDQIHQDIKMSTGVTTPRYGKIITCDATHTSACLVIVAGSNTITYKIISNQLTREVDVAGSSPGTANPITPTTVKITSLSAEYFGNYNVPALALVPTFQILITGSYNSSSPSYQYSETKQATFASVSAYSAPARGVFGGGMGIFTPVCGNAASSTPHINGLPTYTTGPC